MFHKLYKFVCATEMHEIDLKLDWYSDKLKDRVLLENKLCLRNQSFTIFYITGILYYGQEILFLMA